MTDKEKAVIMAYTGVCMLTGDKFQIFHKYIEDIMGRPIMTHEIGLLEDIIKEKSKVDFIALCEEDAPDCDKCKYYEFWEQEDKPIKINKTKEKIRRFGEKIRERSGL